MSAYRSAVAALALAATLTLPGPAAAHVGSPDVFLDGQAGPYRLFVTVRPPRVIPGVADVEILVATGDVREMRIVPLPLTGPGANVAPVPDVAAHSREDPRLFTGHLWMMTAGAWQVQITVMGDRGSGSLSVPVPTLPQTTREMSRALSAMLFTLMLILCAGFVSIVAAAAREASLDPGRPLTPAARRRGRIAAVAALVVAVVVVLLGNTWWATEASGYAGYVYKPLEAEPSVTTDGQLRLVLRDPGWIRTRRLDDFVADHGHLMHLFIVSPALDRLWHLHPDQAETGTFVQRLPDLPAGRYELFADVVHATGIFETVVTHLETTAVRGARLANDDSMWAAPAQTVRRSDDTIAELTDGGRIVWLRDRQPLATKRLTMFAFRVEDAAGQPAPDLDLYMGMPGHAVFVRRDRRVFAHVHPSGSAPMAAVALAARALAGRQGVENSDQAPVHRTSALPAIVSFPYGFPEAGDYRIFVQVKRAGRIETAVFDARVDR